MIDTFFSVWLTVGAVPMMLIMYATWVLSSLIIRSSVGDEWLDLLLSTGAFAVFILALIYLEPNLQPTMIVITIAASLWGLKKYWNDDDELKCGVVNPVGDK